MVTRRGFIGRAGGALGVTFGVGLALDGAVAATTGPSDGWSDEAPFRFTGDMTDFEAAQRALLPLYDVERDFATFDAAYYGAMTRPVAASYRAYSQWVNRNNSLFLRNALMVIGGIVSSTLLTLLVLPVLYRWWHRHEEVRG